MAGLFSWATPFFGEGANRVSNRRINLPQTVEECHKLILELYETIDELLARIERLERELYGPRRERFVDDDPQSDDITDDANLSLHESSAG